jgi:hypothetical protein
MKPQRSVQGQFTGSIPELIDHLRELSSRMGQDPTLGEAAEHIRHAVLSLESARKAAFEVYKECLAASGRSKSFAPAHSTDPQSDDASEWLWNLQPASPLKQ